MQFHQRQLTRATQLVLREHGLYVSQRDGRGQVDLAVEIPYEELLPIRLERRSAVPGRGMRWLAAGILWVVGNAVQQQFFGQRPLPAHFWGVVLAAGLALALLLLYALHNWWRQAVVHTANLRVVLADHPRDRQQLRAFTQSLEARTKTYLRQHYGQVNPLSHIEPQLRRLAWLGELNVLSPAETRALTTRLTGQVPAAPLRSLGQELEGLFVN